MSQPEAHFLHTRDNQLQKSAEVNAVVGYLQQNGESIPNSADTRIQAYLGFLANEGLANNGFLTGERESLQRQVEASIIDATPETAEAYFLYNAKLAGQDGIRLDTRRVSDEVKLADVTRIQSDQRKQLTEWADYVTSSDAAFPNWFKFYVMNAVPKLTKFNDDTQKFENRSNGSFSLFPELDRESLALTYDVLSKKINKQPVGQYNQELLSALDTGSFARIYAEANKYGFAITPELRSYTKGEWKKYDQTTDSRTADMLAGDVSRYRTGWCTAGKETAHTQLTNGDFYVWYSHDAQGRETVPRIAIRMEQGNVREVRGIGKGQELEPELIDTAMTRLQGLKGGTEYIKKASDMKLLTSLQKRLVKDTAAPLSKKEVKFLYELGSTINGFGYETDPRIGELKKFRGDRDHILLKELAVEYVDEGFEASYGAYQTVIEQIKSIRGKARSRLFGKSSQQEYATKEQLAMLYQEALSEWQKNGVLDYVANRIISHGELHTPLITPNILVSAKELKQLAKEFGNSQPYETYVYDELYDSYSDQELSGYMQNGKAARVSLIPNKYSAELGQKPVVDQHQELARLQAKQPGLGLHIPSVLGAVTYWNTLRAQGDGLKGEDVWLRTYIRHFDLEAKRLAGSADCSGLECDRRWQAALGPLKCFESQRCACCGGQKILSFLVCIFHFLFMDDRL